MRCPRVRGRVGEGSERIRFSSAVLAPYAHRSKNLEVLMSILCFKGGWATNSIALMLTAFLTLKEHAGRLMPTFDF